MLIVSTSINGQSFQRILILFFVVFKVNFENDTVGTVLDEVDIFLIKSEDRFSMRDVVLLFRYRQLNDQSNSLHRPWEGTLN